MSSELSVISKSKDLVILVYNITKKLPKEELYCLSSQIRRAVVSVPSNLGEGSQKSPKSFCSFIDIARGSLIETKIQLEIIERLYNIDIKECLELIDEIGKMSYSLKQKILNSNSKLITEG